MYLDHAKYIGFTGKARLNKAVNSLLGIVEGISLDCEVNSVELDFLSQWLDEHREFADRHPFSELVPVVAAALRDGVLTDEERADILFLCRKLSNENSEFYDRVTCDLQRLHAVLGGIASDSVITEGELKSLAEWLDDHGHLQRCWPYDEIGALTSGLVAAGKLDATKHALLLGFFSDFAQVGVKKTLLEVTSDTPMLVTGLCAVQPEIRFRDSNFCFTGALKKWSRNEVAALVTERGGRVVNSVTKKLNYLIVGSDGNPCWAYSCYGRKVEEAMAMRKEGAQLVLVHEFDFADAIADG